jgi:hypothetical protein
MLALTPGIDGQEIDQNEPVKAQFDTILKSSTVNSTNASLWPDPLYAMWFGAFKQDDPVTKTSTVLLDHPAFLSNAEGGHNYYPVFTHGIKSTYQICMYPAKQVAGACDGSNTTTPYCCNGVPSSAACQTDGDQKPLPGNE